MKEKKKLGRKKVDPKEKIVPITTHVKAKYKVKGKKLIDEVVKELR